MKKLFFLPLLLITCFCLAQNAQEIIGKPIKIGNLLVAQNDFPDAMNFEDAKKACRALGKGWRLPSLSELDILYRKRERIGNFADTYIFDDYILYWSLTGRPYFKFNQVAVPSDTYSKSNEYLVRAVKSL
jgi:hypothetical protein